MRSMKNRNTHKNTPAHDIEKVFATYYGALCYYAARILDSEDAVEDIVQEVFVALLEKGTNAASDAHLKNYLYQAVKNGCLNHIRKNGSRKRYLESLEREDPEADEDRQLMAELYRLMAEAVAQLPPECRKVCHLAYFDGVPNEQIAQMLDVSINTVKAQKARAKKLLKEALGRRLYFVVSWLFL